MNTWYDEQTANNRVGTERDREEISSKQGNQNSLSVFDILIKLFQYNFPMYSDFILNWCLKSFVIGIYGSINNFTLLLVI